ncbi:hypothetical protein ADK70_25440 [Streptomyces rimosus subsp. pseudoverticillatus]|uniref:hypothetical protein n=1 Tax=Streptomyces rimosus TaxID=1927 RepID=UPI0006B279EF|nr:hypothetical protein [Streptomyces rimosus]KOT81837.1 hypothetical protein ADK70_25440 [Streptomyces rimosus subsp. pseudoverticillatus]
MGIVFAILYVLIGMLVLFDIGGFITRRCERVQSKAAERHREMMARYGHLQATYVAGPLAQPAVLRALGLPLIALGGLLLLLHLG